MYACGDAVVDQPLQEPERCGSPFLFDRVKKLLAGEHPPPDRFYLLTDSRDHGVRWPRGDHLRSPGRRLGRAAGELDLPQGRSPLGARLFAKGWTASSIAAA